MIDFTPADEVAYEKTRRRVRHAAFGFYRDLIVAEPKPVQASLSLHRPSRRISEHPGKSNDRPDLLPALLRMRKDFIPRKRMAEELGIGLSYVGKLLTKAKEKGLLVSLCKKCGEPTEQRAEARYCKVCKIGVRRQQMREYNKTHEKSAGRTK